MFFPIWALVVIILAVYLLGMWTAIGLEIALSWLKGKAEK